MRRHASVLLALLFFLVLPRVANSQLIVPARADVGQKVVAEFKAVVPDDGKLSILWTPDGTLESEQVGQRLFLWGKAGRHSINVIVIPLRTITIGDQTFDVIAGEIRRYDAKFDLIGNGPTPPDPPDPPDPPGPDTVPFPSPGLAIMILREASPVSPLPAAQASIFTSSQVRQYMAAKCVKLSDGQPAARAWDDDLTDSQLINSPPELRTAYRESLKLANGRLPWICISTGTTGFSGPLPGNIEDMMTLLRKYGG